ncbi:MAG: hypothetical protein GXP37_02870 [Chloroflexi bacterium]|nr:hypothetical protein [Chloroflexota bacterium]
MMPKDMMTSTEAPHGDQPRALWRKGGALGMGHNGHFNKYLRSRTMKQLLILLTLLLLFSSTSNAASVLRLRGWITENGKPASYVQVIAECDGVRYNRVADAGGFYNFYLQLPGAPQSCSISVIANDTIAISPSPGHVNPYGTLVSHPTPGSVKLEQLRFAIYWTDFRISSSVVPWAPWDNASSAVIGYGRPMVDVSNYPDDGELYDHAAVWYNWWYECSDKKQLPMAGRPDLIPNIWGCNDGRPLLLLNEPDIFDQANLTPMQTAEAVKTVMNGGWHGDVYCCGTFAVHTDYMLAVIRAYERMYGHWPITNYHIHAYAIPTSNDESQTTFMTRGEQTVQEVRDFISTLRQNGYLVDNVVISEYGGLSRKDVDSNLMASLLIWQTEELRKIPEIRALLWFSTYYPYWWHNDLLNKDGSLTLVGKVWKLLADEYN